MRTMRDMTCGEGTADNAACAASAGEGRMQGDESKVIASRVMDAPTQAGGEGAGGMEEGEEERMMMMIMRMLV